MPRAKKPAKQSPAMPGKRAPSSSAHQLDRDPKGRPITVGCVVCSDGPTYGRVVFIQQGAIVYRPYDPEGRANEKQPLHTAYHDEVDVVDSPAAGVNDYALQTLNLSPATVASLVTFSRVQTLANEVECASNCTSGTDSDQLDEIGKQLRKAADMLWALAEYHNGIVPLASGDLADAFEKSDDGGSIVSSSPPATGRAKR